MGFRGESRVLKPEMERKNGKRNERYP